MAALPFYPHSFGSLNAFLLNVTSLPPSGDLEALRLSLHTSVAVSCPSPPRLPSLPQPPLVLQVSVGADCRFFWSALIFIKLAGPREKVQVPDEGGDWSQCLCPVRSGNFISSLSPPPPPISLEASQLCPTPLHLQILKSTFWFPGSAKAKFP